MSTGKRGKRKRRKAREQADRCHVRKSIWGKMQRREGGREERKTKGGARVCHSLKPRRADYGRPAVCISLHARTLFHARIILAKRRRTHDNRARKIYYENWDLRGLFPIGSSQVHPSLNIFVWRITSYRWATGALKWIAARIRHVRQIFQYYF